MRFPQPRFTIRQLIIMIAVAALLIGAGLQFMIWPRITQFRSNQLHSFSLTEAYALSEARNQEFTANNLRKLAERPTLDPPETVAQRRQQLETCEKEAANQRRFAAWAAKLSEKYAWGIDRPWARLEPDLPPPLPEP